MVVLAGYLAEAGAPEKALGLLDAVIAAHPDYAEAYNSEGVIHMRLRQHARARAAFAQVLELDPDVGDGVREPRRRRNHRGRDDGGDRRSEAGVSRWIHANTTRLYNLGAALHDAGRRDEARPYLERFVRDAPPARYAQDIARFRAMLQP